MAKNERAAELKFLSAQYLKDATGAPKCCSLSITGLIANIFVAVGQSPQTNSRSPGNKDGKSEGRS